MNNESTTATQVSSAQDYRDHEATYNAFMAAVKWSIISVAVLVVFLYFVIRP